jgi:shikimate kinase
LAIKKDKVHFKDRDYILVSTAHPAKFYQTMDMVKIPYDIPEGIKKLDQLKEHKIYLENDYSKWKEMLLKNSMKSVTFIGMPFSGKSYIGNLLAKKLDRNFVDFDKKLEEKFNKDLGSIVSNLSEDEFRIEEENIVIDYIKKSKVSSILSPGGSIVYCKKAMEHIKKNSLVVYLDTPLEILLKRYEEFSKENKKRGIVFKNGMGYKDLFEERKELYESYYDIKINSVNIEFILNCLS